MSDSLDAEIKWTYTLQDGVDMARRINEIVISYGYYAGLTGSTLLKGGSFDDIDVIVYPSKTMKTKVTPDELMLHIEAAVSGVSHDRTNYHEEDDKIVNHLSFDKWEVDIFLLK